MCRLRTSLHILPLALVLLLATVSSGCLRGQHESKLLSYDVSPYPGGISVTVADHRPGEHTVWVVLTTSDGKQSEVLAAQNNGDSISVKRAGQLAAGVYRYSIYSAEGMIYTGSSGYLTSQNLIASGRVTVTAP
jgi:hypothetical protein